MQVYSGLETKISFPSSNVVTGKVMLGVDRTQLKALIDTASALDESKYTTLTDQAVEAALQSAQTVYDTVTATQEMVDEQTAALQTALDAFVENSDDGNYYYFKNTVGWKEVYAYWWGGSSDITACPGFPGIPATLMLGTKNVYYVVIPDDATGFNFSNGKAGTDGGEQTNSMSAFEPNKLLKLDLDSKYVKNGGYRYAASYVDLKAFVNGQKYGTGDVNGDGTIDINDVTMLQNGLAGSEELSQTQLYSADANYDGKVSIDDATKISLYIAQSISAF